MTDEYGLGAIQSPPSADDYKLADLVAATGHELTASPPPSFMVAGLPPILNQGSTPMCVAYSSASLKALEDRKDQGKFFDFDKPLFFRLIGGGPNGAYVRNALDRMLKVGYPIVTAGQAGLHRIASYYLLPTTKLAVMQALFDFGPLIFSTPWYHSWFHPVGVAGKRTLPAADYQVGGHAIMAVGYRVEGVVLRNSWGASWADGGSVIMPWAFVEHSVWEAWKAVDVIDTPPPPAPGAKRMHAAAGTYTTYRVAANRRATVSGAIRTRGFSATCELVTALRATGPDTISLIRLTSGVYKGRYLHRTDRGISVT